MNDNTLFFMGQQGCTFNDCRGRKLPWMFPPRTTLPQRRSYFWIQPPIQASKPVLLSTNEAPEGLWLLQCERFLTPPAKKENLLLYRKENSALDPFCRHNVRLSRLFVSRKKCPKLNPKMLPPPDPIHDTSTPCKGILTFFLFSKQFENISLNIPLLTNLDLL